MSGKKYREAEAKVDRLRRYSLDEALAVLEQTKVAAFDETVDLAVRLGVDPKQSDQMVRGAAPLPHGLGKTVRVVVFAKGEKAKEAQKAGADLVGAEDLVEKVEKGWMEFDKAIATPDMMGLVSKLGRILGPRGLMPNPKLGTVSSEVAAAVKEQKQGKAEFKIEKAGIVHAAVGKISFGKEKLKDNIVALMDAVVRAKPASSKGLYLRSVTVSTTMGPGLRIDPSELAGGAGT